MLTYCGQENKIKNAVLVINQEGFRNSLIEEIINAEQFTYTILRNASIADIVHTTMVLRPICINVYFPKWRWSKAIGYFSPSKPNQININGYKLKSMSVEDIVSNFCHEITHLADNTSEFSFGHGSNKYTPAKDNSAPYAIGSIAKSLVNKAKNNE